MTVVRRARRWARRAVAEGLGLLPWTCPGALTAWGQLGGWDLLRVGLHPTTARECRRAAWARPCPCGKFRARMPMVVGHVGPEPSDPQPEPEPEPEPTPHDAAIHEEAWDAFLDWLASGEPSDKAEFERIAPYRWRYTLRLWDSPEGDVWATGAFEWVPPVPPAFSHVVIGGYRWAGVEEVEPPSWRGERS